MQLRMPPRLCLCCRRMSCKSCICYAAPSDPCLCPWATPAGTRIFSQCITILALGCPPLLVLLQQLCLQALLPRPAVLCAAPLLADPLTRSRMRHAWIVLDMLPLPHDVNAMGASVDHAGALLLLTNCAVACSCGRRA